MKIYKHSPNTNVLGQSFVDEVFHRSPSLLEWRVFWKIRQKAEKIPRTAVLTEVDLAIIASPAGREAVSGVDVGQGDGEVNEEEIEIVQSPQVKLVLGQLLHLIEW